MNRDLDNILSAIEYQEAAEHSVYAFRAQTKARRINARAPTAKKRDTEQRMVDAQEALDCVAAGMTYTETATCMKVTRSKVAGLVRVAKLRGMSPRTSAAKK